MGIVKLRIFSPQLNLPHLSPFFTMSLAAGMDRVIALSKTLRRLQSLGWLPSLSFVLRRRQCEEQVPRLRTKIQGFRVHDATKTLCGCQFMYIMLNLKSTETFTWYISICVLFGYFSMERCLFFLPRNATDFGGNLWMAKKHVYLEVKVAFMMICLGGLGGAPSNGPIPPFPKRLRLPKRLVSSAERKQIQSAPWWCKNDGERIQFFGV